MLNKLYKKQFGEFEAAYILGMLVLMLLHSINLSLDLPLFLQYLKSNILTQVKCC